ncbi:MAG: RodZ domain-containing protein [Actinomycetota bacterium]
MSTGIGDALRAARERAGITLADAAAETRIRQSFLAALEREEFDHLGGDVYVKGFLRSYARFLGLDPDPFVEAFVQVRPEASEWGTMASEPIETPTQARRPIAVVVAVVAVLVLGGLAFLGTLAGDDGGETDEVAAPDPVEEETPTPSPEPDEPDEEPDEGEGEEGDEESGEEDPDEESDEEDEEEEEEETEEPDLSEGIVLDFTVVGSGSWARVTVDGVVVNERIFDAGFSETYEGDDILLRIGDAANAEIVVNGEGLGDLGGSGQVVEVSCSTDRAACDVDVVA